MTGSMLSAHHLLRQNTSRVTGLCSVLFSRNLVCSMATWDSCHCDVSARRHLVSS